MTARPHHAPACSTSSLAGYGLHWRYSSRCGIGAMGPTCHATAPGIADAVLVQGHRPQAQATHMHAVRVARRALPALPACIKGRCFWAGGSITPSLPRPVAANDRCCDAAGTSCGDAMSMSKKEVCHTASMPASASQHAPHTVRACTCRPCRASMPTGRRAEVTRCGQRAQCV